MSVSARNACLLFGTGLSLICGCGGSPGPATAYVSGTVTMNGSPVTAGRVMFFPTASDGKNTGKSASGQLTSSGDFELTTYSNGDGAVIGEHTISVLKPRDGGDASLLGMATPQKVTVSEGGDNTFTISLAAFEPAKGKKRAKRDEDENEDD